MSKFASRKIIPALLSALVAAGSLAAQTIDASFDVVCIADPNAKEIGAKKACLQTVPRLSFGDKVTLAVEHAPEMNFDDITEPNPADLVLFLEGRALPGARAQVGRSDLDDDMVTTTLLTFEITRDLTGELGRKNWKEIIVASNARPTLAVSVGLEDGPPARTRAQVNFVAIERGALMWWGILALAGSAAFFLIAIKTNMLRDKEPGKTEDERELTGENDKEPLRAYSLSRCQMALWTMMALIAYLFIWCLTGEYNATIPASIVGMMGVSVTTYVAASAIDSGKVKKNREKLRQAMDDRAPRAALRPLVDRATVCASDGFWKDIATSAEGASLHRLQFIVWTLALAVIFVVTVYRTLAMPDFDATLLGLMGITSGTYATLKVPEEKT